MPVLQMPDLVFDRCPRHVLDRRSMGARKGDRCPIGARGGKKEKKAVSREGLNPARMHRAAYTAVCDCYRFQSATSFLLPSSYVSALSLFPSPAPFIIRRCLWPLGV